MCKKPLVSLGAWLAVASLVQADETLPTLKVGDKVYQQVTITKVTATDIFFIAADGMGNVKLKNLDPDLQKHFHYDAYQAEAQELKRKDDNSRYHQAVLHHPPSVVANRDSQLDESASASSIHKTSVATWGTDIPSALNQARSDNKHVLLDFTGSDWNPWCIRFDEEVLKQSAFLDYAGNKLELVRLDFPRRTPLSPELKAANNAAGAHYKVDNFPTYILLNSEGRELGRQVGYRDGGPSAFLSELDTFAAH